MESVCSRISQKSKARELVCQYPSNALQPRNRPDVGCRTHSCDQLSWRRDQALGLCRWVESDWQSSGVPLEENRVLYCFLRWIPKNGAPVQSDNQGFGLA